MLFGLIVAIVVAPVAAALFAHEDGGSAFDWMHAILVGMGVSVAVAASILTVCGVRTGTNGGLRDLLAQPARWLGFIRLLTDDVARALELERSVGDDTVDRSEVVTHLDTELRYQLLRKEHSGDAKRAKEESSGCGSSESGCSADPWLVKQPHVVQSFVGST